MVLLNSSRFPGVVFFAAIVAMIASWAEVAKAAGDFLFIPYNGMDADKFGEEKGPYTTTDPLRQHLHLYQIDSEHPTPVYFYAHENGKTAALKKANLKFTTQAGYSVISWESETVITQATTESCAKDFELVWSWFKANAAKYNLDPKSVVIGGKARGSRCSWPMAYSGKPEIEGIYMYNALLDSAWQEAFKSGSGYVWDQAITKKAPPAYLVYGEECPKPITQECEKGPRFGQKIVDAYTELGIGSRIQVKDGLNNIGLSKLGLFPEFVSKLPSHSDLPLGSSGAGKAPTSSGSAVGSSAGKSASSTSLGGGEYHHTMSSSKLGSSSAGKSASSTSLGGGEYHHTMSSSKLGSSSDGKSASSTSLGGGEYHHTMASSKLDSSSAGKSASSALSDESGDSALIIVIIICTCCILAFFSYDKYHQPKRDGKKSVGGGDLSMQEMGQSSYRDNPDELPGKDTYQDEPQDEQDEPQEKRIPRKKSRKKSRKKRQAAVTSSARGAFDF